jgi:hypothetical protein
MWLFPQLHFRGGIQGTPDINDTAQSIKENLSKLIEELVGKKISLDEKLDVIDKYQQEVHQLKQKLTVEEVKLLYQSEISQFNTKHLRRFIYVNSCIKTRWRETTISR